MLGIDCIENRLKVAAKSYDLVMYSNFICMPLSTYAMDWILAEELIEHLTKNNDIKALNEF